MRINYSLIDNIISKISLYIPKEFGLILSEKDLGSSDSCDNKTFINLEQIEKALLEVDPLACLYFGMSKLAIVSDAIGDVVIKIPFNGYFIKYDNYSPLDFTPFLFSPSETNRSDYCMAECEKYEQLKQEDLECFVSKTQFYKDFNNFNVYLQEYIEPVTIVDPPSDALEKIKQLEHIKDIDSDWLAICIENYGKDKVQDFLDYCYYKDSDILADIHNENWGYRESNHTPTIFDYSNYLE